MKTPSIPARPLWTFVRAALVANLVVAGMLSVVIVGLERREQIPAFPRGFWLMLLATLIIWGTAAALCAADRVRRRPLRPPSPFGKPKLRDKWLDSLYS